MSDLAAAYRFVFSTPEGQIVLDDICLRFGMFAAAASDEQRIRENCAKEIFALAAADDDGQIKRVRYVEVFSRLQKKKQTTFFKKWSAKAWQMLIGLVKRWVKQRLPMPLK